jgi:hypothetical protein
METELPRCVWMLRGRTGRFNAGRAVIWGAVVGADARIVGISPVVRGRISAVLSFGLESGGAGKESYNRMTLSRMGDGVESRAGSSGSWHTLEFGVGSCEASNIFVSRTIG